LEIESDLSQVPGGSGFPIRTHTTADERARQENESRGLFGFPEGNFKFAPNGQVSLKFSINFNRKFSFKFDFCIIF